MENIVIHRSPQLQPIVAKSASSRNTASSAVIHGNHGASGDQHDRVSISDQARAIASVKKISGENDNRVHQNASHGNSETADPTSMEMVEIQKLQIRDAEVKAHEQAHKAVAGHFAPGGPSYTYEIGPNGKKYAVEGEVPIDLSKEATPEETILKMYTVARAALAPANPSSADRRIAARANMIANQARGEIQIEQSDSHSKSGNIEDTEISNFTNFSKAGENGFNLNQESSPAPQISRRAILDAYSINTA